MSKYTCTTVSRTEEEMELEKLIKEKRPEIRKIDIYRRGLQSLTQELGIILKVN